MRYALVLMLACAACGTKTGDSTSDPNNKTGDSNTNSNNGGDSNNKTTAYAGTDISGFVTSFPLNGANPNMNDLVVYAQDAVSGAPLTTTAGAAVHAAIDPAQCGTSNGVIGCAFSLKAVDLSKQAYGLQLVSVDSRTTGGVWALSVSGTAPQAAVAAAITGKTAITKQTVFALDANGVGALAAGTAIPGTTLVKGAIVGLALDANQMPVTGATVAGPTSANIVYPNYPTSAAPAPGSATDASGLFVITPNSGATVQGASFTVTATGKTYPQYPLSVYTNEIFFVPYVSTK